MIFEGSTKAVNSTGKESSLKSYFKRVGTEFPRDGVNVAERSCTATFSAEVVDADGEVILIDGIDLSRFHKNPVVLLGHYSDSPIGRCLWTKAVDGADGVRGLRGKVAFGRSELAEESWGLVQDGILSSFSIGMLPESIYRREPTLEEAVRFPDVKRIIASCTLLEVSLVACPANPNAIIDADEKGRIKLTRPALEVTIKAALSKRTKPSLSRVPGGAYRMNPVECARWSKFVYPGADDNRQLDPDRMVFAGTHKSIDLGPWPTDPEERVTAMRQLRAMEAGRL